MRTVGDPLIRGGRREPDAAREEGRLAPNSWREAPDAQPRSVRAPAPYRSPCRAGRGDLDLLSSRTGRDSCKMPRSGR